MNLQGRLALIFAGYKKFRHEDGRKGERRVSNLLPNDEWQNDEETGP